MKSYRLISLAAAVVMTLLFARVFMDEKIGVLPDLANDTVTVQAP
jgi:hypothetical protein